MTIEEYVNGCADRGCPIICDSYDQTVEITNLLLEAGAKHGGSGYSKRVAAGSQDKEDISVRHPFISGERIEYYYVDANINSFNNKLYYSDFVKEPEEDPVLFDSVPDSFNYLKGVFAL